MHSLIQIDLDRTLSQDKPRRISERRGQPEADRARVLRFLTVAMETSP